MTRFWTTRSIDAVFAGTGELPSLCRGIDWSATRLGDVARWPPSLCAAVRICLDAGSVPMAVWAGPDLTLIYNQSYADILGPSWHPRALGRPARDISPPLGERLVLQLRRVIDRGEATHHDCAVLAPDRRYHDGDGAMVTYSLTPVRGDKREIVAALNVIHGTTRAARPMVPRRAASAVAWHSSDQVFPRLEADGGEGSAAPRPRDQHGPVELCSLEAVQIIEQNGEIGIGEERFRTLADNIDQLAWSADETGSMVWFNQRWYDYTGTRFDDVQGWRWQTLLHPDHAERVVHKIGRCFETGERWDDTFPLRGATGEYRWFLSRAFLVRDAAGHVVRWFGTNTDISEQRAEEDALRDADHHKSEFLAWLSHELRNPFGLVRTSLVLMQRAGIESERGQHALAIINRQVTHMGRLLEDLLDITRIAKGKILLRRECVELNEIVRTAAEDHRPVFEVEGIALEIRITPESLRAQVDTTRLVQIVCNLLLNATKFTSRGGHVAISLNGENDLGIVEVRDDGAGIPPELLATIFEPLVQDKRTLNRSRGGLGLGLPLVKGLVELHGGTVSASSDGPGRGAVFTVRLPLDRRGDGTPEAPPPGLVGAVQGVQVKT